MAKAKASKAKSKSAVKVGSTQAEIISIACDDAVIEKTAGKRFLEALKRQIVAGLNKNGSVMVPVLGIKLVVKKTAARKKRTGINPFTKQEQEFAAKPAGKTVRARALKKLKDEVV